MNRPVVAGLLGLLIAAGPLGANAAELIQPGYWESTNRMLSPIPAKSVERRCITPADVAKFLMGPSNRHYACTYPTRSFEGGKILLKGSCVSKKGRRVQVEGQGSYSQTSFSLTAQVATEFSGIPIAGKVRTEAKRIGDACPAPAAS
ncbi:MAG: DUF3617 family protein [Phenylobacterium sp.]|uniref:DUF3617 domain-containing protein n=1 Tax=Phenylobacterium sp. TaxID=1871053 RepID=UPI0027352978|nr:DUF3617 family protein [Phenylobacterium sp.]MDP3175194.1 DUF3617 family protein [Phenylobacterium sp.]